MQSFSVPTSPAVIRSSKNHPVTPQRSAQRHRHTQSFYRSPITPASPYTPLSLRSFVSTTSNGSSTLTTPNSSGDSNVNLKRVATASPEAPLTRSNIKKDTGLADAAQNWRSRASENGIKVGHMHLAGSQHEDDEGRHISPSFVIIFDQTHIATDHHAANDSGFLASDEGAI